MNDQRDALALQMKAVLHAATFNGQAVDEHKARKLIDQGNELLEHAGRLTGH